MIHLILRQIKSTAVVVFQSSRTRIPSRTKSLGLISGKRIQTLLWRSDVMTLLSSCEKLSIKRAHSSPLTQLT
ncbi:unnamed protein product [Sphagnum troendelagicum]|uniref:Uncharacterized protein n=1 Tax=Sphagnum troendelagicum TaxID=128251 RepID=A0ABP0UE87_9BRYO